jgi:hydrogenase nickel incorporation protein HypB
MCETCGCGEHNHDHGHDHGHNDHQNHKKIIDLNIDIMTHNNIEAALNRGFFMGRKIFCINMVSSPGSGKTTILEKTIGRIVTGCKAYVIEGDQQTFLDSDRIKKAGAPSYQINTGTGCHLDAHMVSKALKEMDPDPQSVLFIENVGNLVCPAMFDLGEDTRVLITSVTEGEDKPLKYPLMFETAHLCLLNKSDLYPYVDFKRDDFTRNALSVNHNLRIIELSAKTGEGMDLWFEWIRQQAPQILFTSP